MPILLGVLVLGALLIMWLIAAYNALVKLRLLSDNAWSDVDVQLKRRHDLVPNLVETVKGYAKHERETLDSVIKARNQAVSAPNPSDRIEAENALSGALKQLFALAEAYPDLKANTNFLQFQGQMTQIEGTIVDSRRYYNAVVRDYNTRQVSFPVNLIAGMFGFSQRPFFAADQQDREAVKVQF